MGEIYVNGIGVVRIKGDAPDEEESQAILNALPQDEPTQPTQDVAPVTPQAAAPPAAPQGVPETEGRFGVVPPEMRQSVRETVEEAPGLLGFLAEMGPATAGMMMGAAAGAPLGPVGVLGGGIIGGVTGEAIGQETGVTPVSDVNLALAGAGPVIGRAIGGTVRLGGKITGGAISKLPPAKVARARTRMKTIGSELESIGADVLSKAKGLTARPAKVLYRAARASGVKIAARDMDSTRKAVFKLRNEMEPLKAFPEVRQAMRVLEQVEKTFQGEISFDTIVGARKAIGAAIRRAESAGGPKLGAAKKVFKSMSEDLDKLAKSTSSQTAKGAAITKAASQRAKMEFAVSDMEEIVEGFTKAIPEGGTSVNVLGLLNKLRNLSTPASKQYRKNFVDGIGKAELDGIMENLQSIAKVTGVGGPGGPGSLVVRSAGARMGRAVVGGLVGFGAGGPLGAGIGGIAGANLPEMITAGLMTKAGSKFLENAAMLGRGEVSRNAWMIFGQIVTRSSGQSKDIQKEITAVLEEEAEQEQEAAQEPQQAAAPAVPQEPAPQEGLQETLNNAREAIKQGVPRDQVEARLRENGIDPGQL